jgi:putative glutamine amidotransferase
MRRSRSSRPVVGIVGHCYVVPKRFGDLAVVGTPVSYVRQLVAAGARPVLLPGATAYDLLDVVDAVVLTGGGDVDPSRYGGSVGTADDVDPARDDDEIALVRVLADARMPLLGVCRGMQVLAVAFGGTLTSEPGWSHVLPEVGHPVTTRPHSALRSVLGERPSVTSLHHQAVADPGSCWHPTAWTDDGVIEAMEWNDAGTWPVLGVQWHPELEGATGAALFGWLVREASRSPVPPVGIEPTLSRF